MRIKIINIACVIFFTVCCFSNSVHALSITPASNNYQVKSNITKVLYRNIDYNLSGSCKLVSNEEFLFKYFLNNIPASRCSDAFKRLSLCERQALFNSILRLLSGEAEDVVAAILLVEFINADLALEMLNLSDISIIDFLDQYSSIVINVSKDSAKAQCLKKIEPLFSNIKLGIEPFLAYGKIAGAIKDTDLKRDILKRWFNVIQDDKAGIDRRVSLITLVEMIILSLEEPQRIENMEILVDIYKKQDKNSAFGFFTALAYRYIAGSFESDEIRQTLFVIADTLGMGKIKDQNILSLLTIKDIPEYIKKMRPYNLNEEWSLLYSLSALSRSSGIEDRLNAIKLWKEAFRKVRSKSLILHVLPQIKILMGDPEPAIKSEALALQKRAASAMLREESLGNDTIYSYEYIASEDLGGTDLLMHSLPRVDHEEWYYEIRYDINRLSAEQIDVIKAYKDMLERKYNFKEVKLRPFSGRFKQLCPLISIYCKAVDFKGEGHIDVFIPRDTIDSYALNIVSMLNIALAASFIPDDIAESDIKTYQRLIDYIKGRYKVLMGRELLLEDPSNIYRFRDSVQMILLVLSEENQIGANYINRYSLEMKRAVSCA